MEHEYEKKLTATAFICRTSNDLKLINDNQKRTYYL